MKKQKICCRECKNLKTWGSFPKDGMCSINNMYMDIVPKTHPRWCPVVKKEKEGKTDE